MTLKKSIPMIVVAVFIVSLSATYVFKKNDAVPPQYGWPKTLGNIQYPSPLNLNTVELKGNINEDNRTKLDHIFYGSDFGSGTSNNVCKNFSCKAKGSPLENVKASTVNTKNTPYCINPTIKNNLDPHLCPAKGDECYGNCNILYDTLVKNNIDDYSGMRGVDKILHQIGTSTVNNNNEAIQQQYKNQIKYLLCQMGQQNIYDYEYGDNKVESMYFTWENICQMNGWPSCGGESRIALGFYIISFIVAGWMSVKILYGMFKTNKNVVFKELFFGAMPSRISKGTARQHLPIILQYFLSYFIYWVAFIYLCNSILLAILSESQHSGGPSDYLNSVGFFSSNFGTGDGTKTAPVYLSLGLFLLITVISRLICNRELAGDNIDKYIHAILVLFTVAMIVYYFLIIRYTHIGASYNPNKIKDSGEKGITWPSEHGQISVDKAQTEGTSSLLKIFPYLWMGIVLIPLLCYLGMKKLSSLWGNNNGNNNKGNKGNNNNSTISRANTGTTGALKMDTVNEEFNNANASNHNIPGQCGKLTLDKKKKGGLIFSTILMISYVAILSTNIFIWFVAPSPFIVLMILQRLIMTNFIPSDSEEDWRANWDFILFPLLNYLIKNLYGISDNELSGKSNSNIFKYIGKGNKGTNKKPISSASRAKIKSDLNNMENRLLSKSTVTIADLKKYKDGTESLGSNIGSLGKNRSSLGALQKLTGGSGKNTMTNADLHVHIKYLLELIDYIENSGDLNNDNLKTLKEELKTLKGRHLNIKRRIQFKKFKKLTEIIDNLITAINKELS